VIACVGEPNQSDSTDNVEYCYSFISSQSISLALLVFLITRHQLNSWWRNEKKLSYYWGVFRRFSLSERECQAYIPKWV